MIGVPYEGKYKEVLCADATKYGGEGNCNPRMRQSKNIECDARKNSIQITVPAFGCSIFKYNVPGVSQSVKKITSTVKAVKNVASKTVKESKVTKKEAVKKAATAKAVKESETAEKPAKKAATAKTAKESETVKKPAKKAAAKTVKESEASERPAKKATAKKTAAAETQKETKK